MNRARRIPRTGVIDIGSNSVRLVVYEGPRRAPAILFNEKVAAGLGRDLATTGRIGRDSFRRGIDALQRYAALAQNMALTDLIIVATAAVRDAENGPDFIAAAAELGLEVRLLSGEEEAAAAGYGVIAAFPDADGVVADLGGGSLELVHVSGGAVGDRVSLPYGVLRLPNLLAEGEAAFHRRFRRTLRDLGWDSEGAGRPLYLVGGSWRALSRLDMQLTAYALPVMDQHDMPLSAVRRLRRATRRMTPEAMRAVPGMSGSRVDTLADAAVLLDAMVRVIDPSVLIVSSSGLREGLLYQRLTPAERAQDPLLVAAEAEGERLARFPIHGRLLDRWISPLFLDDDAGAARLRLAACLLSDVAWTANPDFRAERGREIALHGNWRGIDIPGRVRVARALHSAFGGRNADFPEPPEGVEPADLTRAHHWGLAIRLAQRMSGGVAAPLEATRLAVRDGRLRLTITEPARGLMGEMAAKRLDQLARAMGLVAQIEEADE